MQFSISVVHIGVILCTTSVCLGIGFLAPVGVAVGSIVAETFCGYTECCSKYGIPSDFDGLEDALKQHLYGQHLVQEVVINALKSHWNGLHRPQKALTLSFHGGPGSGKTYVTKFIVENLYKYGSKSNFVHNFISRFHFPLIDKVPQYQEDLHNWIRGNVTKCAKQLFIFDEVEKMSPKVLDIIKPMIDYRDDVDGVDYRDSIFIFLSNTGAELINEQYLDLWNRGGMGRDDLKLKDFESLITIGAFNEEGGWQHADAIKNNLIDHYIPFLPMEKRQVRMCIIDEFKQRGVMNPREEHINEAIEFIQWGPSPANLFSTTGCKRISAKVGTIVSKYQLYMENNVEIMYNVQQIS